MEAKAVLVVGEGNQMYAEDQVDAGTAPERSPATTAIAQGTMPVTVLRVPSPVKSG